VVVLVMIELEGIALFENLIGRSGPNMGDPIRRAVLCWFDSMDRLDTIRYDTFGFLNLIGERDERNIIMVK